MALLGDRDYTYYATVRGVCRSCRELVPARIVFRQQAVYQERLCPRCGKESALIAGDRSFYLERMAETRHDHAPLPVVRSPSPRVGCPGDCGPCSWHASPCQLPVFSVTNACNLRCPICFTYNRSDRIWHMSTEEMRRTLDWVVEATGGVDVLNLTGGEPSLHPRILELIALCQRPEIGRVTLNSNGILLARDPELCRRLGELGVYVVLSFNTFSPETSRRLHGCDLVETKLRAIEALGRAGVKMTLLHVMIRDENEETAARLFELMRQHDHILSLTIQTMTYTGQGGSRYPRRAHLPVDVATEILCRPLGGELTPGDFVSRPSAHPLCYSIAYLFKAKGRFLPFTRSVPPAELRRRLGDSYLLGTEDDGQFFLDLIHQAYAAGDRELLPVLRSLVQSVYPSDRRLGAFERQRAAEAAVRTVYVHSHMDEDTFDCARAMLCPDQVPVEPGRLVPACTYNLFYRQADERFFVPEDPDAARHAREPCRPGKEG